MVAVHPLKRISLFKRLSRAELSLLEARSTRRRYPAGTLVIREGEDSDSMFVILNGEVDVLVSNKEGKPVKVDTQGKGDYFGEYAVLDGSKRTASVITTQETDMLTITREAIVDLIVDNPESALYMMGDLVGKIRDLTDALREQS